MLVGIAIVCHSASQAQETRSPKPETVLANLNYPGSIAVHPKSGQVYVSDCGNARIIRIVDGKVEKVIIGFPKTDFGPQHLFQTAQQLGPAGIAFTDLGKLLVASNPPNQDGSRGSGQISLFDLPETNSPVQADQAVGSVSLANVADAEPERDFFGIACTGNQAYVTGTGGNKFGWVNRLVMTTDDQPEFKRFIDTMATMDSGQPTAITISPDGFVVVGSRGQGGDSMLAFFDQADARLKAKFNLSKDGMVALAYGPNQQRLFALLNSKQTPDSNGLYKLVGRRRNTECELQLIQSIENPWKMAFAPNGKLYITAGTENGSVLCVSGLDDVIDHADNGDQR